MTKAIIVEKPLFNREEFLKLKTKQAKNEYLRGVNLIRADLSYMDLSGLDLSRLDLSGANFRYADLREADLRYADLREADLRDADLRGADLRYADLREADLRYADLRGADLRDADLRGADLRANFRCADLTGAKLPKHKFATISGYRILIFESHIQVGCYVFTHEDFLQDKAEELTAWKESEKKFFRQNKEEIIKLVQEFNLNKGGEND